MDEIMKQFCLCLDSFNKSAAAHNNSQPQREKMKMFDDMLQLGNEIHLLARGAIL